MRIEELHTNIVKLSAIRRKRAIASSPFGPVRAGLTTLQTTRDQALTELLNYLEREPASQRSRSYTVSATSVSVTTTRVGRLPSTIEEGGTDIV